ncbi:MAG: hypothetical protein GTN78_08920, partial [Gemmatimonadales bacterium]|nr:hypothetical protein [Gemmatimonadales bacterium]
MKRLLLSPVAVFAAAAFCVFAMWELFNHLYLMRLPMVQYHLVSLVFETVLAGAVALVVIGALVRQKARLEELDRQKEMLTNALVHDLRQPLSAVLSGLEMVERVPDLPDETKELIGIVHQGGFELLEMVNDLLDVARLEAGQPLMQLGPVRPSDFVLGAVRALEPLAMKQGIALTAEAPPELPEIRGDAERLRRVILNLVGNALKFTRAGGGVKVEAHSEPEAGAVVVSVSDTGEGIPEE